MKIKLLDNIPVEDKHKMTKGREFEVVKVELADFSQKDRTINNNRFDFWVMAGEEPINVWSREAEIIDEEITEFLLNNPHKKRIEKEIQHSKELKEKNKTIDMLLMEIADFKEERLSPELCMLEDSEMSSLEKNNIITKMMLDDEQEEYEEEIEENYFNGIRKMSRDQKISKRKLFNRLLKYWTMKYKTLSPITFITGFILRNGTVLNVGMMNHVEIRCDFEEIMNEKDDELLKKYGLIRTRPEGGGEINIEVRKKPTKSQIKTLSEMDRECLVRYDFWDLERKVATDWHSNDKGVSRYTFLKDLNTFWNK